MIKSVIIDGVTYVPIPDPVIDKTLEAALEVRFDSDAGNNLTIRDYLYELLWKLWNLQDGFNGKRPFGNSGWSHDLYTPLIRDGFLVGTLDEDGRIKDFDRDIAENYVFNLITAAIYGVKK